MLSAQPSKTKIALAAVLATVLILVVLSLAGIGPQIMQNKVVQNMVSLITQPEDRLRDVPMCSWMSEPLETRYARISGASDTKSPGLKCFLSMNKAWNKNLVRYAPYGGHTIAARAKGGFHGNSDDGDFDFMMSRAIGLPKDYVEKIGCDSPGYGNHEQDIHSFPDRLMRNGNVYSRLCQCEMDGHPFACFGGDSMLSLLYLESGASWWVPVPSGGKDIGYPAILKWSLNTTYFDNWRNWPRSTLKGLEKIDLNNDTSISLAEFAFFIRNNPKVNQKWVDVQLDRSPCVMIGNAWKHLHFVQKFLTLSEIDRSAATAMVGGDIYGRSSGHYSNRKFSATYTLMACKACGYWYHDDEGQCRQQVQAAFREHQ